MISSKCIRSAPVAQAARALSAEADTTTRVMKFGGSSVGSAAALQSVGEILGSSRRNGARTVGVLSAMFGVTNKLIASASAAEVGDAAALAASREAIWALHERTAGQLMSGATLAGTMDTLHQLLADNFDVATQAVLEAGEASTYELDVISSVGERLSNELLAGHLRERGFESVAVQADDVIVTDGVSGNSMPLLEPTQARVQATVGAMLAASDDAVPLVTGFFGASEDGKLTTLGRGGSDLTAATVGYCLDADAIDLFKVEYTTEAGTGWMKDWEAGFVGVVHDADVSQTIEELDYKDARELAHFGKKVLHPETVAPAVAKNIPIYVKNTLEPHLDSTVIRRKPQPAHSSVVSAITKIALHEYQAKHPVDLPAVGDSSVIIALVGEDLCRHDAQLGDACVALLADNGIEAAVPERVNGSSHNFAIVVADADAKPALRLLHHTFVDQPVSDVLSGSSGSESEALQFA